MKTKQMKTNNLFKIAIFSLLLFVGNVALAQTTISGSITDSETGEAIPGANIIVVGSRTGAATDFDGNFVLTSSAELPFNIEVSSIGFNSSIVEVTSADQEININLQAGRSLDEIIISASRRPQKIQESPQSVSIITAKDLENSSNVTDPMRSLVNIPGVQLQQQSANVLNIEMRAGSGVFGTSTFPMLDYRNLFNPTSSSFLSYQSGLSNIDIAKIEVVRGANSALYGPGVSSGIVHFLSKNPIDYPGTTVELIAGELATTGAAIRHAWANDKKTFGYKINAKYLKGNDFNFDPDDPNDQANIALFKDEIRRPFVTNGVADATQQGSLLLSNSELYPDGKGLKTNYRNSTVNAHLEYRPTDKTNMFLSGGVNTGDGFFANSQGYGRTDGSEYWTQFRLQTGGLFAQVYYVDNNGGGDDSPTFLYGTGLNQIAKRNLLEAQVQYNFQIPSFLNSDFTVGFDTRNNKQDSENTIWGRNELNDDYQISGLYLQGTLELGSKLDLTFAGRYDSYGFLDDTSFAPRVALVYKASPKHTFRASYNQAAFIPSALQMFIDFPVNSPAPGLFDIWLSGQANAQTFSDQSIDMTIPGWPNLPAGSTQIPNAYFYGALGQAGIAQTLAGAAAGVAAANPAAAPLLPIFNNFFTTYQGPSGATGQLVPFDLFTQKPMTNFENTGKGRIGTLNSFELGYQGIWGDKWAVSYDFYTYSRTGITRFTQLAPSYVFAGSEAMPADMAAAIVADLIADPTINATVLGGISAQYAAQGIPLTGIPGVAPSAAAQAAGTVAAIAAGYGQGFIVAGQNINNNPLVAAAYPIIGAIEADGAPDDSMVHASSGYRDFGDATRSHYGMDLSLEYFINDEWTWYGNSSWLSQTDWAVGDDDLPFTNYLNTPKFKFRTGFSYAPDNGFRGRISFQHDDAFTVEQGLFINGIADEKNLFDMSLGYQFNKNFALDLSGNNIFDQKYRAMPGLPVIGRRILAKATFNF
jgi:iron complex outermembrane receptor protein